MHAIVAGARSYDINPDIIELACESEDEDIKHFAEVTLNRGVENINFRKQYW
ncbi:MAG: hypothetical protein OEZ36_11450 [Spirochaetota bacterium]|nr:hypothetical protein [Spirochaetota bacterium]